MRIGIDFSIGPHVVCARVTPAWQRKPFVNLVPTQKVDSGCFRKQHNSKVFEPLVFSITFENLERVISETDKTVYIF